MAAPTVTQRTVVDSEKTVVRTIHIATLGDVDLTTTNVADVSALTGGATGTSLAIRRVSYALNGFSATLIFDATTDVPAVVLSGTGEFDFSSLGGGIGLTNNAGTGVTGDILLSTSGVGTTDDGFIMLELSKV